ncbi:MAG: hypothetical protein LAT61_13465 [Alcanivorax sp.]|nr:hypothetical protein [Alcanivorax sp.]
MMTYAVLASLVLATLVYAALATALLTAVGSTRTPASRWPVIAAVAICMAVLAGLSSQGLFDGLSDGLSDGLPGAWAGQGRFSITSGLLAVLYLLHPWCQRRPGWGSLALPDGQRRMLIFGVIVAGLVVYPAALGLGPGAGAADIWGAGFGDFRLSTGLLCLGLALWVLRAYHLCLLLVAAQCAFALQLLPSGNLWDYLLDPWLCTGAIVTVLWALARPGTPVGPVPPREA